MRETNRSWCDKNLNKLSHPVCYLRQQQVDLLTICLSLNICDFCPTKTNLSFVHLSVSHSFNQSSSTTDSLHLRVKRRCWRINCLCKSFFGVHFYLCLQLFHDRLLFARIKIFCLSPSITNAHEQTELRTYQLDVRSPEMKWMKEWRSE